MKKIKLSKWIEKEFVPGSEPTQATVRRWIERGDINGVKLGETYYVYYDEFDTGNELADIILKETA